VPTDVLVKDEHRAVAQPPPAVPPNRPDEPSRLAAPRDAPRVRRLQRSDQVRSEAGPARAGAADRGGGGSRASRAAAVLAASGFFGIAVFQLALAAGAPWGHAAWGGAHAELSTTQRFGSAVAVAFWSAGALIVLGRAGVWRAGARLAPLCRPGTWFLFAVSALSALVNFASPSSWERYLLGPLALLLAILCLVVARSSARRGRV